MTEPKIHISRAIWDEDTHEVAYIVDGVMTADVGTQRKLNAVDDMYEALEEVIRIYNFKEMVRVGRTLNSPKDDPDKGKIFFTYNDLSKARDALRKARGEGE
jgi:hypothetical protein